MGAGTRHWRPLLLAEVRTEAKAELLSAARRQELVEPTCDRLRKLPPWSVRACSLTARGAEPRTGPSAVSEAGK